MTMQSFRCIEPFVSRPHRWKSSRVCPSNIRSPHHLAPQSGKSMVVRASKPETEESHSDGLPEAQELDGATQQSSNTGRRRQADSTDWVASQLTRRFGCVRKGRRVPHADSMGSPCTL